MIRSFRCRETQDVYQGRSSRRFQAFRRVLERKLALLDAARVLTDLHQMRPIHPGEILDEEFLKPLGMSASALALALHVPPNRVSSIIAGKRAVTADTALRLARALKTTPEMWLNLQQTYDLRIAELDKKSNASKVRPLRLAAHQR